MKKYVFKVTLVFLLFCALLFFGYDQYHALQQKNETYQELRKFIFLKDDPTIRSNGSSYIGEHFVDFTLEDLSNRILRLQDFVGQIKVIIIFSTKDCSSCLQEYRLWKKINQSYTDNKIQVIGIAHDEEIYNVISFAKQRELNFPILYDPNDTVRKAMDFRFSPLRVTLNKNNTILEIVYSDSNLSKQKAALKKLESWLEQSLITEE